MKHFIHKNKGFSMMESALVLAIFITLIGGTVFFLSHFLTHNTLASYGNETIDILRRSQTNAMARYKDGPWGVAIDSQNNKLTMFKGASFAARDQQFDSQVLLPSGISLQNIALNGGGTEILFERATGKTGQHGTFELLNQANQEHFIFSVNAYGQIEQN